MRCPRCQHENPTASNFCLGCGTRFSISCSSCDNQLPAGSRFCNKCGTPVGLESTSQSRFSSPESYTPKHLAERILTSKAALEGERKQVTVLFADLKGSMELLADRDPEEARKILDAVLDRHDGGGPPLRGHGEPGHGRRDHGALRRPGGPRGPRRARLLRGAPHAGDGEAIRRRGASRPRRERPDPGRTQLRRGGRPRHRQRSPHGLHRRRPDHPPGREDGAAGRPGHHRC